MLIPKATENESGIVPLERTYWTAKNQAERGIKQERRNVAFVRFSVLFTLRFARRKGRCFADWVVFEKRARVLF